MISLFVSRRQLAARVGRHRFGIRTSAMREYYSERSRHGWRVFYLPFGLRAFHTRDRILPEHQETIA